MIVLFPRMRWYLEVERGRCGIGPFLSFFFRMCDAEGPSESFFRRMMKFLWFETESVDKVFKVVVGVYYHTTPF